MFALVFMIVLIAALAGGSALALDVLVPKVQPRRRMLVASFVGALLPMLIPIAAVFFESAPLREAMLAIVVLAIFGFILAATVGFPDAYWVTRRRGRGTDRDAFR